MPERCQTPAEVFKQALNRCAYICLQPLAAGNGARGRACLLRGRMPIHLFAGASSVIFAEVSAVLISIGTVVQGAQT